MFYAITFISIAIIVGLLILNKFKGNDKTNGALSVVSKILCIAYLVLMFINIFLPDGISARLYPEQEQYRNVGNLFFVLLRWANDLSVIALTISVFFKKKSFSRISVYFLAPVLVLCISFFSKYVAFWNNGHGEGLMNIRFFSPEFKALFLNMTFRSIYQGLLFVIEGALIGYIAIREGEDLLLNNKTDVRNFALILLGSFLAVMPIYAPSYLTWGYSLNEAGWWLTFKIGSFQHIVWLLLIPIEIYVLYRLFSKLNDEDKYIAMLSMAIALFFEFNGIFTCFGEIVTQRYPLQLCNIAPVLILAALLSKNRVLSVFCSTVNVVGALIAFIMCDSAKAGITYIMNVHYIVEHTKIVSIMILSFALGVLPPIDKKDLKNVIIGFSIYYAAIYLIGGTFRGLYDFTGNDYWKCNYLFMFDREKTVAIAGFVGVFFDINFKLFNFYTFSLMNILTYCVFLGLSIGYFYLQIGIKKIKAKHNRKAVEN
ncbi:MAG: YwaF family protein [Bacilli bacterium]|nr:YwaF family protein [Bacilli bacterium]